MVIMHFYIWFDYNRLKKLKQSAILVIRFSLWNGKYALIFCHIETKLLNPKYTKMFLLYLCLPLFKSVIAYLKLIHNFPIFQINLQRQCSSILFWDITIELSCFYIVWIFGWSPSLESRRSNKMVKLNTCFYDSWLYKKFHKIFFDLFFYHLILIPIKNQKCQYNCLLYNKKTFFVKKNS